MLIIDRGEHPSFSDILVLNWLELYRETKNPIYAWRAYQVARFLKKPVPEEVLQYLDGAASGLVRIANDPPRGSDRPLKIARAFGLGKEGAGPESCFGEYTERHRLKEIAIDTHESITDCGKEYLAFESIAEKHGISKATVRRNYIKHTKAWRKMADRLTKEGVFSKDKNGKMEVRAAGNADDFRELAIIMDIVEEKRKDK